MTWSLPDNNTLGQAIVAALVCGILAWYLSSRIYCRDRQNGAVKNKLVEPLFMPTPVNRDFQWDKAPTLDPYPFKPGPFRLTMGIRNLSVQHWLLIEPSYLKVVSEKRMLLGNCHPDYPPHKDIRSSTLFAKDEAGPAIKELYTIITKYMLKKYPMCFSKQGNTLYNKITDRSIPYMPDPHAGHKTLLEQLAETVEEDFIILLKDPSRANTKDGQEYFFKAGVFAFAAGFDPLDRFDTPLLFVHHPIPGYEEKLKPQMNRFFDKLAPGKIVTRSNFSAQTHARYFADNDNKGHNLPPGHVQTAHDYASLDFERQVHYRSERQTLTKLPETGAVVFTIRTYLFPFATVKKEGPELCERLIGAIEGLDKDMAAYKRACEWGPPVIRYLSE